MKNYDVLISHAKNDADWCEQLAEHLRDHGLQAFLEKRQTSDDVDLVAILEKGLAYCTRAVLVLTPAYLIEKKNWVAAERLFSAYQTLTGHREFVISLLLKDCKLPPLLREYKCLDFRDPTMYQFNLNQLSAMLKDASIDINAPLPSVAHSAVNHESKVQDRIVTIGGTFDTLHKGHKEYIRLAFQFADHVIIYLNSDEYAHEKKDYNVRPYETRVKRVKDFIEEIRSEDRCEIRCLHKLEEVEFDYLENEAIRNNIYMAIVPPEYYARFLKLNYAREERGMQPFLILIKPRKRDSQKGDFSSSAIRYHGV